MLSLFDDVTDDSLGEGFQKTVLFGGLTAADVPLLEHPDGINLAKTAVQYSDGVILASPDVRPELVECCKEKGVPMLPFNAGSLADGTYVDEYNSFYDQL